MAKHLLLAGVPATGKSWLGEWLAESMGYLHIDAEKNNGDQFDRLGLRAEWNSLFKTLKGEGLVDALDRIGKPVVVSWGFQPVFISTVNALRAAGVRLWWLDAPRDLARVAFERRGGIDVRCFDRQMDEIASNWAQLEALFRGRIVSGLNSNGSQRRPDEIWSDINKPANQRLQPTARGGILGTPRHNRGR